MKYELTKKQRRAIYLRLAKHFERCALGLTFKFSSSRFICLALCEIHNDMIGEDSDNFGRIDEVMQLFPEILLFEPTPSERVEEGLPADKNICSAWWNNAHTPDKTLLKEFCHKKSTTLFLCAEICK